MKGMPPRDNILYACASKPADWQGDSWSSGHTKHTEVHDIILTH